jgi:hypothetical protein
VSADLLREMIPSWYWSLFRLLFHCLFPLYPFSIPLLPPDPSFQEILRHSRRPKFLSLKQFILDRNLRFILFFLLLAFPFLFCVFF